MRGEEAVDKAIANKVVNHNTHLRWMIIKGIIIKTMYKI